MLIEAVILTVLLCDHFTVNGPILLFSFPPLFCKQCCHEKCLPIFLWHAWKFSRLQSWQQNGEHMSSPGLDVAKLLSKGSDPVWTPSHSRWIPLLFLLSSFWYWDFFPLDFCLFSVYEVSYGNLMHKDMSKFEKRCYNEDWRIFFFFFLFLD